MKTTNCRYILKGCVANGRIDKKPFVLSFFNKSYYECMGDIIIPSEEKGEKRWNENV